MSDRALYRWRLRESAVVFDGRRTLSSISVGRPAGVAMIEHDRPWNKEVWRITFMGLPVVGPVERSTHDEGHPDPEWQALTDVLYWSWCCRLQAGRLRSGVKRDLLMRSKLYVWNRKNLAATSWDEHSFVVASGNLDQALERAEKYLKCTEISQDSRRVLRLLRNIYEHWDGMRVAFRKGGPKKIKSAKELVEGYPEAEPWKVTIHEDGDIKLAKVVSLRTFVAELRTLEAAAHWGQRRLRREGRHQASDSPRHNSRSRRGPNPTNAADA